MQSIEILTVFVSFSSTLKPDFLSASLRYPVTQKNSNKKGARYKTYCAIDFISILDAY